MTSSLFSVTTKKQPQVTQVPMQSKTAMGIIYQPMRSVKADIRADEQIRASEGYQVTFDASGMRDSAVDAQAASVAAPRIGAPVLAPASSSAIFQATPRYATPPSADTVARAADAPFSLAPVHTSSGMSPAADGGPDAFWQPPAWDTPAVADVVATGEQRGIPLWLAAGAGIAAGALGAALLLRIAR